MEALSGKRYEHIHVGLTEAIPGFRHFRKEPPSSPPTLCKSMYWQGVIFTCA
ncbi:hypothetical protein EDB94_0736 [Marinobacter sp. 3-2]|jgi:hypothetical protein|nr:hypothetical protein EDB94_0736 [Marinobacter sp. 3-2]